MEISKKGVIAIAVGLFAIASCATISIYNINKLKEQRQELQDKVTYYENVITDFGIEEFIHYPELYYEEGFVEQALVHNCMWAFDQDNEEE